MGIMSCLHFWHLVPENMNAVIFPKFKSVCICMHARSLGYLDMPYFLEHVHHAHVHAMHMPDMMSLGSHIMQTTSS